MNFNQTESYGSWSNNHCSEYLSFTEKSWAQFSNRQTSLVSLIIISNCFIQTLNWILMFVKIYVSHTSQMVRTYLPLFFCVIFIWRCKGSTEIEEREIILFSIIFWGLLILIQNTFFIGLILSLSVSNHKTSVYLLILRKPMFACCISLSLLYTPT